jgi:hypothetical protein
LSTWTRQPAMLANKAVPAKIQIAFRFIRLSSHTVVRYQANFSSGDWPPHQLFVLLSSGTGVSILNSFEPRLVHVQVEAGTQQKAKYNRRLASDSGSETGEVQTERIVVYVCSQLL